MIYAMISGVQKFIYSRSYYIFAGCCLLFNLTIFLFSADFGYVRSFTNSSDSMAPDITTGSIIIVKKSDRYNVGDAISFYSKESGKEEIVTHRITGIGGNVYVTKGDANQVQDREIVLPRLVIGKVERVIPYLGYVVGFAKSFPGTLITIILPALFIVGTELSKIARDLKNSDKTNS